MIPKEVNDWLGTQGFGGVSTVKSVGGGCINNGCRIQTEHGPSFFLKTNQHSPKDMFAREADGLALLAKPPGAPRVPRVFLWGVGFLLLEDLAPGPRCQDYWHKLGMQMANLHQNTAEYFGFEHSNYIGSTPQPNPFVEDGFVFFGEYRLNYQAELAARRRLLTSQEAAAVARMAAKLVDLVPVQAASIIHGDLWSGNIITDVDGQPAIIDPAAHYGWAEADLAMMTLFGSTPAVFFRAYEEIHPLSPGFQDRFPIYNLYHLLNHLNLFGGGYYHQVMSIVRSYG